MIKNFELSYKFTRRIWKKLYESNIPIVKKEDLEPAKVKSKLVEINSNLRKSQYFPDIGHGFLGVNKKQGVTRFIPILSANDMAVYYYVCYLLSDKILEKREGIYGGWHIVPDSQKKNSDGLSLEEIEVYLQDYFSDSISKKSWWKDWTQFVQMIAELTSKKEIGNYVLISDIANFYDSISIDILIRKLRKKAPDYTEHIDILEVFLAFWNRRITGYTSSTKGIPQEQFSDASRVLSHFYLQDFDAKFQEYCNNNKITYARWADDILLFGSSKKKLEDCLHRASKLLLVEGLYLSAGKTKIMTRSEYRKFRCIAFLEAVQSSDLQKFEKALRDNKKAFDQGEIRVDTLLKTTIGHAAKHFNSIGSYPKLFIDEAVRSNVELSLTLNDKQFFNIIRLNPSPKDIYKILENRILAHPYASSRAAFLMMLRNRHADLVKLEISKTIQRNTINKIEEASKDSELLCQICIPAVKGKCSDKHK